MIQEIKNKLNLDECVILIDWFNQNTDKTIWQNSESLMLTPKEIYDDFIKKLIENKVQTLMPDHRKLKIGWMTFANIKAGGSLVAHKDMVPDGDIRNGANLSEEILTMVFYLSNNFKGGELVIEDQYRYKPKLGSVILFDGCNLSHEVSQVQSGNRYTLTVWCIP